MARSQSIEERVLKREEFGLVLVDEIDELLKKHIGRKRPTKGSIDLALPVRIGFNSKGSCTCRMVCTYRDGTLECICNCSGDCDGTEPCNA